MLVVFILKNKKEACITCFINKQTLTCFMTRMTHYDRLH